MFILFEPLYLLISFTNTQIMSDNKQDVTVTTSSGKKYYKIGQYGGKFQVYKDGKSFEFGGASKKEDAISLIREDASQFGKIEKIEIN